jgi:hypothetical protein
MPHIDSKRRRLATAALMLVLASLALAACGSSSKSSSSSSTSASASTPTAPATKAGLAGRFAQVRECLKKNGAAPPAFKPGSGLQLPQGVTRAQYEAALKKCGGLRGGRGLGAGAGVGAKSLNNPRLKQAFVALAACMREHGVKIGEPNLSGKGPIFNTSAINTSSAQFKTARTTCTAKLRALAPGLAGGGGAPGAPGGAPTG